jgi:phosphoesterase RecJ-like protein
MEEFGVIPKDLEGIVSQLRVTKDIEVAIFIYELNENEYKVSLRASGDVNVSQVAVTFGGGGHVKAAGLTMTGTIPEIIAQLTAEIEKQL